MNDSKVPNAMQYFTFAVKGLQVIENGLGPDHWNSGGWDPSKATDPSHMTYYAWEGMWANIPFNTRKAMLEAYLRNWMDKNKLYPASQYYSGDAGGLTQPTYVPVYGGSNFGDTLVIMFKNSNP